MRWRNCMGNDLDVAIGRLHNIQLIRRDNPSGQNATFHAYYAYTLAQYNNFWPQHCYFSNPHVHPWQGDRHKCFMGDTWIHSFMPQFGLDDAHISNYMRKVS